jgi:hypothetical protein
MKNGKNYLYVLPNQLIENWGALNVDKCKWQITWA